jgi:uncharacterized membrane protein
MVETHSAYFAIAIMCVVTLSTRLGGAFMMRFLTMSPRLSRFLEAMSASVLAAIVMTFLVSHGARESAAVGAAIIVMLATRSAVYSMFSAMIVAAGWTFFLAQV